MAIQTATQRTTLATAYSTPITYIALATTTPSGTAGTEVSGGSPAYARKAANWGTASASVIVASPTAFDVPASTTVVGINMMSAITAGTYLDGATVTSQAFASQGTYTVVATYTQS
jgi:hypothetical protein